MAMHRIPHRQLIQRFLQKNILRLAHLHEMQHANTLNSSEEYIPKIHFEGEAGVQRPIAQEA